MAARRRSGGGSGGAAAAAAAVPTVRGLASPASRYAVALLATVVCSTIYCIA